MSYKTVSHKYQSFHISGWCTRRTQNYVYCITVLKPYTIARLLEKNDNITVSRRGIAKFLKMYEETQSISRRPGSGRLSKITASVKQMVEQQMP